MTFEWIKEKTNKVIKAVEDTGTALAHEAQALGESALQKIKSITGTDSKPAEAKAVEAKAELKTEAKAELKTDAKAELKTDAKAEPKTESPSAAKPETKPEPTLAEIIRKEITSSKLAEKGEDLAVDAQMLANAAKKVIEKQIGSPTVTAMFSRIVDISSTPITMIGSQISFATSLASLAVEAGKKIGNSISLFDTEDRNLKVAVSQGSSEQLNRLVEKELQKAIDETMTKQPPAESKTKDNAPSSAEKPESEASKSETAKLDAAKSDPLKIEGTNSERPVIQKAEQLSLDLNNVFEQVRAAKPEQKSVSLKAIDGSVIEIPQDAARWIPGAAGAGDRTVNRSTRAESHNEKPVERVGDSSAAPSPFEHSHTNLDGGKTEITTLPGVVRGTIKDASGNIVSSLDKTNDRTIVAHKGEKLTQENGKTIIEGTGYKVTIDENNKRTIEMTDGTKVISDGKTITAQVGKGITTSTGDGQTTLKVDTTSLHQITKILSTEDLERVTKELGANLKGDETTAILINDMQRYIFADGVYIDVFKVKDTVEFIANTQEGKFRFRKEDGAVAMYHEGERTILGKDSEAEKKLRILGAHFHCKDKQLEVRNIKTDMNNAITTIASTNPEQRQIDLALLKDRTRINVHPAAIQESLTPPASVNPTPSPAFDSLSLTSTETLNLVSPNLIAALLTPSSEQKISSPAAIQEAVTIDVLNDGKMTISAPTPSSPSSPAIESIAPIAAPAITIDSKTNTVVIAATTNNPEIKVTNEEILNVKTGTRIDREGTVRLGTDGPVIQRDGTVRFDRDTVISRDLHVESKGWQSSTAQQSAPITEAQAQGIAMLASGKASAAYSKAIGAVVRWSHVADLNCALGDLTSMMGLIPPGSPAFALLMRSYGLLMQALSVAAPKAEAMEKAISAGLNNESEIKQFANGNLAAGNTPINASIK